jgi:hypothetical protein
MKAWQFYIIDKTGNTINIATKTCKQPQRTNLWKAMQCWLTENPFTDFDLYQIGYRIK